MVGPLGGEGDLAIRVAYRGDHLIGALPLCVRRRAGLRVSEFVGGSWALLADLLVAPDEEPSAVSGLLDHAASSRHDFASLFGLQAQADSSQLFRRTRFALSNGLRRPVLDLSPGWNAVYDAKMSSKARSTRRRRRRQLEALGTVETSVARTREELEPALEDAFRVYALRWEGRHDPSGFITPTGMRSRLRRAPGTTRACASVEADVAAHRRSMRGPSGDSNARGLPPLPPLFEPTSP